jgi:hypothetical protein
MNTDDAIKIQGLILNPNDIETVNVIKNNPSWHQTRLSKEICELWNWKRVDGNLKDMACRTMLLKFEKQNFLKLPQKGAERAQHRKVTERGRCTTIY